MQIIVGARRSGKTTKLIEMCAEKGGYIVCMSRARAHRITQIARKMELKIPLPITFDEFLNRRYATRGNVGHLYIDDADMLLRHISRVYIAAITLNDERGKQ